MKPAPFDFARAASLDEAVAMLAGADGDARPLAGGQSLGPMLNLRITRPSLLVDISRIEALKAVVEDVHGITIGAFTTHAAIEDGEVADVTNGLMRHVASGIAYRAVRNRGTIGGSLAHADPAADWPPVMIALDATLRVRGPSGSREIPAAEFITNIMTTALQPGEILETIHVPRLSGDASWGHYKVCVKPGDFADSLGVVVRDGACRAVLAGPSRAPAPLVGVAAVIQGADRWTDAVGERIKEAATADIAATAFCDPDDRYAVHLHRTVITRAAREALS